MKITLIGPCSPKDIAHLMYPNDARRAGALSGYRGVPVSSLAEALLELGHEICVVTTAIIPPGERQVFRGRGLEMRVVMQRNRARDLAFSFFKRERNLMLKELATIESDVIHAHWTYEFALAALATQKPVLVTAHDAPVTILRYLFDPYRFFRLLMAYLVRLRTSDLSTVSPYLLRKWRKDMFWWKSTPVIPNIAPFTIATDVRYRDRARKVLTISDGGKRKNVKSLLKAWPSVLEETPDAQLDLVGHGLGCNDELAQWAAENLLDQSVVWHGYLERKQLSELLAMSDVLVHPSLEESFGLTLLEAMSHGVPVVAGMKSGGVPFVVGNAGLLVNVRKPEEIKRAIIKLLTDKDLRQQLGTRGQDRVKMDFSGKTIAKQYIAEYERIMIFR